MKEYPKRKRVQAMCDKDNLDANKNCRLCVWTEVFEKRPDEPTNCGCRKPGWEGYVDPQSCCCFFSIREKRRPDARSNASNNRAIGAERRIA
jgi:hypothetical protein